MTLDEYSHVIPSLQQVAAEKFGDIFKDDRQQNKDKK